MLTVKLEGGLGNQLFELSALYAYARRNNYQPVITHRIQFPQRQNYWQSVFHKVPNYQGENSNWSIVNEYHMPVNFTNQRVKLDGYFQDVKHFNSIRAELLDLFTLPSELQKRVDDCWDTYVYKKPDVKRVMLHVRRGDYLYASSVLTNLSLNYYRDGIDKIEQNLSGDKIYYVFTDDPEWCRKHLPVAFPNQHFEFVTGNDEVTDLYLMTKFDGYIMANSSFSWFGWYLNPNAYQVPVVAPGKWFTVLEPRILVTDHFLISDQI